MSTHDQIAEFIDLPDDEFNLAANDFLASRTEQMRMFAQHFVNRFGDRGDITVVTDVLQEHLLTAYDMIQAERAEPGSVSDAGPTWEAMLRFRGRGRSRGILERKQGGSGAGGVTQQRKTRFLGQRRTELYVRHQVEPTTDELVDYANQYASQTRKDAARQSMQFTDVDVEHMHFGMEASLEATLNTDGDLNDNGMSTDDGSFGDDFVVHPCESPMFVNKVIDACGEVSDACKQVASVWFGEYLTGKDTRRVLEASEIAKKLGVTHKSVNHQQTRIREIAVEVFTEMFPDADEGTL